MEYSSKNSCQIKIPVFYPTMEEFKNFPNFIDYMESQGAHRAGLAKVVPPKEWTPRKNGYDDVDLLIPAPIKQVASGNKGLFQQLNIQTKPMTVKEFAKLANSSKYAPPKGDFEELERKFWKNLTFNAPIYGADISGTIYDPEQRVWNVGNLGTILDLISSAYNAKIEGVNTAYLYFGMWKTSFCWHTEDMDLYSINYLHYGDPKFWYAIPPQNSRRFERLVEGFFPNEAKQCPAFMRHKMTHISPHVLKRYSIPFDTMVQRAGEFMITFPYAYHAGFNLGYNCAESTNFASRRWIDFGKNCSQCTCSEDTVRIDMDCFVKTYQPTRYELWSQGLDKGHPEDQGKKSMSTSATSGRLGRGPEAESCSFGTVLGGDSNIPESSGSIRKVSRRHPIISLDDPEVSSNLGKSILKTRKHKIAKDDDDYKDDDDGDDDDDTYVYNISESKRIKKLKQSCQRYLTENKHARDFSPPRTESSDEASSVCSRGLFKKDPNLKNVKQKKLMPSSEQTDVNRFLKKVLSKAPELSDVCRLFSSLPFDLNAEYEFHGMSGRTQPHCDICSLFRTNGLTPPELPKSSRPLLNPLYVRTSKHPICGGSDDDDDDVEEEDLLQCLVCNLVVHAGCYGASYQDPTSWVCDRCSQGDFADLRCCLCRLRGGALKETGCSRWVHVTCALVSCQMVLLEGDAWRAVDVSKARTTNARCTKCSPLLHNEGGDFLVECSADDCRERFHVSCAHRSKCQFIKNKIGHGRLQVLVRCHRHVHSLPLNVGDVVVAKHRNHRYYRGLLKNTYEQTFCSVEFEDGSFSKDTFPEDIQNLRITLDDHPPEGVIVSVKWSDGQTYNAVFKGVSQTTMYQVEFEDNSVLNLERRHVWPNDINLPRKVLSRLSEITDTKGAILSFYEAPETLQKRTRGVHLKPIRDNNFI